MWTATTTLGRTSDDSSLALRPSILILETPGNGRSTFAALVIEEVVGPLVEDDRRAQYEVVFELDREVGIVRRTHDLVQLLARANADDVDRQTRGHGLCEVGDANGRDLGHKNLTHVQLRKAVQHEIHFFLKRNPEARHLRVGDRECVGARIQQRPEERNEGAAVAHHVAVANDRNRVGRLPTMLFAATNS